MTHTAFYDSPVGPLYLRSDGRALTELSFRGAADTPRADGCEEIPVLQEARHWLDLYFAGKDPGFTPPLSLAGSEFQLEVWNLLLTIPYGQTTTYGAIARQIANRRGIARMAAQAVGGAVGRNPVAVIVPCHRVIGADGSLTGYGGGMDKKIRLLALEGISLPG